jgi:hypothetical protein
MLRILVIALLSCALFFSCKTMRYTVDNDYSYATDFTRYKTYNFLECEIDTSLICSEIQDAIRRQMKARGYQLGNTGKESLLVSYGIINEKVQYKGFYQPSMERWVNKYDQDETYKPQNYNFGNGMILVSILDANTSELIWRGYASGVFDKKITKHNNYYRTVVRSIFDQYPLFAAGQKPYKITDI